jgi:hypothetical protein
MKLNIQCSHVVDMGREREREEPASHQEQQAVAASTVSSVCLSVSVGTSDTDRQLPQPEILQHAEMSRSQAFAV